MMVTWITMVLMTTMLMKMLMTMRTMLRTSSYLVSPAAAAVRAARSTSPISPRSSMVLLLTPLLLTPPHS